MKQKRLSEVRELVASTDFQGWWNQLVEARTTLADATARYDELLGQVTLMEFRSELTQKNAIDTLYRAGEHEDSAANMLVDATDMENRSFRGVSEFEEKRFHVSELWYRLGAAEKALEEARDKKLPEPEMKALERARGSAAQEYEDETKKKNRMWDEVERLWAKSSEVSLLMAEARALGKKVRREAEGLFALAEDRKSRAKSLRTESTEASATVESARARVATLLAQAKERFGCAAGTDFLYFRVRDDQKHALALGLIDDAENYNLEVKSLALYVVDRQRGVGFLEPAKHAASSAEEGDRRFESYFLTGRKGQASSNPT